MNGGHALANVYWAHTRTQTFPHMYEHTHTHHARILCKKLWRMKCFRARCRSNEIMWHQLVLLNCDWEFLNNTYKLWNSSKGLSLPHWHSCPQMAFSRCESCEKQPPSVCLWPLIMCGWMGEFGPPAQGVCRVLLPPSSQQLKLQVDCMAGIPRVGGIEGAGYNTVQPDYCEHVMQWHPVFTSVDQPCL